MSKRVLNRAITIGKKEVEDDENAVFAGKKEGGSLGGISVNQGRDLRRTLPIIKARVAIDPARLADPTVDLRTLAPASA